MLENITNHDRTTFHAIVKPICKRAKRTLIIFGCVIFTLFIIQCIAFSLGIAELIDILVILYLIFFYKQLLIQTEKQLSSILRTKYHTDQYEMHTYFDQEKVVNKDDNHYFTYYYKDIIRRYELRDYLLLEFKGSIYLPLDKNGFVNGNVNDLVNLLSNAEVK